MCDALNAVLLAKQILNNETPLKTDCGSLCGHACCGGSSEEGMLLFPEEELLYKSCDFGHVLNARFSLGGKEALLFVCTKPCDREQRPLSCMLFPLRFSFTSRDKLKVIMDTRSAELCPLYCYGKTGLSSSFIDAVHQAGSVLLQNEECGQWMHDLDSSLKL